MSQTAMHDATIARPVTTFDSLGGLLARYGLVVVIGWIGLMKFTVFEANGIQPLVANSPFMSWLYDVFSVTTFSSLLGVVEVAAAVLLAVKPWAPRISVVGSVIAIGLFVATLSFLFTTPGVFEASQGGFPMLSSTGQFLIKDVALLGVSVWTLADALRAVRAAG
jgi:reactive chlorine resistance protein C